MKPAMLFVAVFALSILLPATVETTWAHGGIPRGPAGEVPPGQRDPKDPQPPPENPSTPSPDPGSGGSSTPSPSDPGGGGGDPETPVTPPPPPVRPGDPNGGNGLNGGATSPGRKNPQKLMSFTNWLFWWAYNRDEILNLKARLRAAGKDVKSDSQRFFTGRRQGGETAEGATPRMIRERVVPALLATVDNRDLHPDIRGGAIIALARAEPSRMYLDRFFTVAARRSDENVLVKESAIIALGILQVKEAEVREFLLEIVRDREYPVRGRCFAMLSLGLLKDGHEDVRKALEECVTGNEAQLDVPVSALCALGLIGHEESVPSLVGWLESGRAGASKLSDLERAWVVAALGKIGHADALKPIRKALRMKDLLTKRSAAIAMGQIAPAAGGDLPLVSAKVLAAFYAHEKDLTARNFAMISLGRIAGDDRVTPQTRELVTAVLKKAFRDSSRVTERPFVALAMGLVGLDGDVRTPAALKEDLARVIRTDLAAMKGDRIALGAQAIALGMLGDEDSVDLLMKILADRANEKRLRGAAAIGLGLIGDRRANDVVLSTLREREERKLRVDTAVAAGLLGHSDAVKVLVDVVGDRKASQFTLGSVALALGQIGDRDAIEPMIAILEPTRTNGTYPDLTRALVAVALGQLADRRDFRILSRLSKNVNYRASVPAMEEILTIL